MEALDDGDEEEWGAQHRASLHLLTEPRRSGSQAHTSATHRPRTSGGNALCTSRSHSPRTPTKLTGAFRLIHSSYVPASRKRFHICEPLSGTRVHKHRSASLARRKRCLYCLIVVRHSDLSFLIHQVLQWYIMDSVLAVQ